MKGNDTQLDKEIMCQTWKKKWWQGSDWLSFDDSDSIYLMGICYEEAK